MESQLIVGLTLAILFFSGTHAATFTITNNCSFTIWPAALTSSGSTLTSTGFELPSKVSTNLDVPAPWSGRFWARSNCMDFDGKFTCGTADCGSGQVACNNAGAIPPASLVEFTLAENINGQDFFDISLVDGFNLPVSVTPQGGTGQCPSISCPSNVNEVCPQELAVTGCDGAVMACKSACLALNQPQYCCTGEFNSPEICKPTDYSRVFKDQCPQAYSYAYDDRSSTFTCTGGANYDITFCP